MEAILIIGGMIAVVIAIVAFRLLGRQETTGSIAAGRD